MPHEARGDLWTIVLAGGEGQRLSGLARDAQGRAVPKQYCSLDGGPSLLGSTLRRALQLSPPERVVVVVAEHHRRWWEQELAAWPEGNVVVQPEPRGTAAGLLLPLLEVLGRDPAARVAMLPSDHFVDDEAPLRRSLARALAAVDADAGHVVLLGMTPDAPETEYGWILPAGADDDRAARRVARFVEKPPRPEAERLLEAGAVWNTFVVVASGPALLELVARALPGVHGPLAAARRDAEAVRAVYRDLPSADLSRDVLGRAADRLRLVPIPPCGWTDLGTPARVAQCLAARRPRAAGPRAAGPRAAGPCLSENLARLGERALAASSAAAPAA